MKDILTLDHLKEYDRVKGTPIQYGAALPGEAENRLYGIMDSETIQSTKITKPYDIIGTYFTHDINGKYYISGNITISVDAMNVKSVIINGDTITLYQEVDYRSAYPDTLNVETEYSWSITEVKNHYDIYAGKGDSTTFTKIANVDQIVEHFVNKDTVGAKGGIAVLDYTGKVASSQLPDIVRADEKGSANGIATLDADGHIPAEQLPTSALIYKGQWDASTGVYPTQISYVIGDFYIVSVAGVVDGIHFYIGDWIIWNGSAWDRSANTNLVSSVNGMQGAVVLTPSDIGTTKSDVGLGNVENTALSTWEGSSNLTTCSKGTFQNGAVTKVWSGTLVEYSAIETKDADTFYFVIED